VDSIPAAFLTPGEYAELGFMSGLEVHRQLLTSRKLFCHCPPGRYSHRVDARALRNMRPTLSEMGGYDGTALMEFKTKKDIIYQFDDRTVCTYELDDTPPFPPDCEAIDIALMQAMLVGCSLVGEIHVIRKQYLDGSIPTGFQRTFLVGVGGKLPVGDREVDITQISLEEDSCREVSDVGHLRTYRADRLGMPISEFVTAPAFRTPHELAEGGRAIQALARITPIRRGLGTARQDVNVSVRGGTRVEIKGVPRIPLILLLTHFEAVRQKRLLMLRDRLKDCGAKAPELDGARVRLPGWKGLLEWPIGPGKTFLDEVKGRVRVIGCIHSDENVRVVDEETLEVFGPAEDLVLAADEVAIRACEAMDGGVPSETRQALSDGTTTFERILPGADRMYPDTDTPPIAVTPERVAALRQRLPQPTWERVARARAAGVPVGLAGLVAVSPRWPVFVKALDEGVRGTLAASLLVEEARCLERRGVSLDRVDWLSILARGLQKKEWRQALKEAADG